MTVDLLYKYRSGHCALPEVWVHLVYKGQMENAYNILVGKAEVKRPLERLTRRLYGRLIRCMGLDCIRMA
jgi:hypothetical protein